VKLVQITEGSSVREVCRSPVPATAEVAVAAALDTAVATKTAELAAADDATAELAATLVLAAPFPPALLKPPFPLFPPWFPLGAAATEQTRAPKKKIEAVFISNVASECE
jgi:hypothetical protein